MQYLWLRYLFIDLFYITNRNSHHGAAEEVEVDDDVVVVALTEEVAFETLHGTAEDADAVAFAKRRGCEGDGGVGMVEHELEGRHLGVGDYGERGTAVGVGLT